MIKKILVVILAVVMVMPLAGCGNESSVSEDVVPQDSTGNNISEQKDLADNGEETDKEKISIITSVLGMPLNDDGGIELDHDSVELFNNAVLFGYDGTVDAQNDLSKIIMVAWTSNEEYGDSKEFERVISELKKLYGECVFEGEDYEDILGDAYVWVDGVYDCDMVACGLNDVDGNDKIAIYWFYDISQYDSGTDEKLGSSQLIADEMISYDSSSEISDNELEDGLSIIEERLEYGEQSLETISNAFEMDDRGDNSESIINEKPVDLFGLSGHFQFWDYNSKIYIYYELPEKSSYEEAAYLFACLRRLFGDFDSIDENDQYPKVEVFWNPVNIASKKWEVRLFYYEEGDFSVSFTLLGDSDTENDYKDTASTDGFGNGGSLPRTSDEFTSDYNSGIESSDIMSSGGVSSSSGSSKSVLHTCEASGCNKEGIYSIVGISGKTEYYCAEHYAEMNAMVDSMENSVGTTHTCAVSGCNKTGTRSIIGISGQREYYCETHYKEMQDMVDDMLGN